MKSILDRSESNGQLRHKQVRVASVVVSPNVIAKTSETAGYGTLQRCNDGTCCVPRLLSVDNGIQNNKQTGQEVQNQQGGASLFLHEKKKK